MTKFVEKEITCIACPMGCKLEITMEEDKYMIEGYKCKKGLEYGEQELKDPRRIITTTFTVKGGFLPLVPVKTDRPLPKGKIFELMKAIDRAFVEAPVKMGQILMEDFQDTGVNIVATRDLPLKEL
ncbi:DUF1667 domain-containing protein [Isachenkonia alkalipeptolytica]|uniref:DUF1667 domain-containing protein n=1 Tax=Isachenkonia alkalipeptolytica TaxID=2565777 RepID=A0AA43XJ77_9CLOT|nr:DUF1667 domain-containing protein [Isachenkonia alkalipeptolytica]NBG87818.1 DUF1667 domain-containing protein [Isachenkonia alkalipeptolytica]